MPEDLITQLRLSRLRSVRRAAIAATASLSLVAGFGVVTTLPASAGPVPYYSDFSPEVVPTGGASTAYLDCDSDVGGVAALTATAPDASVHTGSQVIGSVDPGNPERIFVVAGPGALLDTNVAGTWSISVDCPSYDPWTTTLDVLVPGLAVSAALDADYDCSTHDDHFGVGTVGTVCMTIKNTTGQQVARIGWMSATGGSYAYPAPGEFAPGTSITGGVNRSSAMVPTGGTVEGLQVWVELGSIGSGDFVTSDVFSMDTPVLDEPLALTTTTGLDAASACAGTGGVESRNVDATEVDVYVCYHVTNQSGVDFVTQDLTDSALGDLLIDLPLVIKANESYDWVTPTPVTVHADTVFEATWTAEPDHYYSSLPEDFTATAFASATVLVGDPTPSTTPTPAVEPIVAGKTETVVVHTQYVPIANPTYAG